ncbi:hypothetical protein [Pedobacter antarcticus]|uniref:hypothetical protein n=1 Tax=Pedobacter antarcticus TaxID=34086 RepID=UPI00292FAC31|nr:hypothetical protein [Pedobacter antarcticus]
MSRSNLKNKKIKLEIIENREVPSMTPMVKSPLLNIKEYDTNNQFDFVQSEALNDELCNVPTPSNESFIII